MKVVILAGGLGSRLAEETLLRPKPMVEIGGRPMLWHILNIFGAHGLNDFVIALGYKAAVIKEYFLNFVAFNNDLTIDLATGKTTVHDGRLPDWKIQLVDTGLTTQTGGRIRRLREWLREEETFMLTYGDGVADVNIEHLLAFHRSHGKLATVTVVPPPGRFGSVTLDGERVAEFVEKPPSADGLINGGFFVLNRKVIDFIDGDSTRWEREPLERLAQAGELMAHRHHGFWQPMDTLREKELLEQLWNSGQAPWKVWS